MSPYCISEAFKSEMNKQIEQLLEDGKIKESSGCFAYYIGCVILRSYVQSICLGTFIYFQMRQILRLVSLSLGNKIKTDLLHWCLSVSSSPSFRRSGTLISMDSVEPSTE